MYNILFICTGNTCRSPMAAVLAEDILKKEGVEAVVDSAGISVFYPAPATGNAVAVAEEYGLDLSGHMARKFTREDLEKADLVLAMTEQHKDYLLLHGEAYRQKIFSLGEYAGEKGVEMEDPFGGDMPEYRGCAKKMEGLIQKMAVRLKKLQKSG